MRTFSDLARQRIKSWLEANRHITQAKLAAQVGVSQTWVSQYKSGDQDADIDQLAAMAEVFGHTLSELLDLRPDPKEQTLIDAFRALRPEARILAVQMLQAMLPPAAVRATPRKRNGG